MKLFKYISCALVACTLFSACEKNDHEYAFSEKIDESMAKIQITRMVPEPDISKGDDTNNRFYKLEIDGKPMWGNDYVLWARMGTVPSATYYYLVSPGTHTMKCYFKHGGEYVPGYESSFTVDAGEECNLFIYDYTKEPLKVRAGERVLTVDGGKADVSFVEDPNDPSNASSFQYVRFINLMFEQNMVAGDYKLQYMYQNPYDLEWYPVGDPVGFGEWTEWSKVLIDRYAPARNGQSGKGSNRDEAENRTGRTIGAGTCTLYYKVKMISAGGEDLGYMKYTFKGPNGTQLEYKDYWVATIGCYYMHIMRGNRIAPDNQNYTGCYVSQIGKL